MLFEECYMTNEFSIADTILAELAPDAINTSTHFMPEHERAQRLLVRLAESVRTERTIEELARHEHPEVRIAVTENLHTPDRIMLSLAADSHLDVRYAVADNPRSPVEALLLLEENENPYVADRARRTIANLKPSCRATGSRAS